MTTYTIYSKMEKDFEQKFSAKHKIFAEGG